LFRESARGLGAETSDPLEASGVFADRFEGICAEAFNDALSDRGADAVEGRRGEVDDEAIGIYGGQELELFKGELLSVARVFLPAAHETNPLADLRGRCASNGSDPSRSEEPVRWEDLAVLGLDPEAGIAGLSIREGDDVDGRNEGLKTP